jgi:hypothetical protein
MSVRLKSLLQSGAIALCSFPISLTLLVAGARVAHAQTASDGSPPAGVAAFGSALTQVLIQAAVPLVVAILTAVIALIPKVFVWIDAHTRIARSAWGDAVKSRFLDLLQHFVFEELQTSVDAIKADWHGGNLTAEDYRRALADVKARVVAKAKAEITTQGLLSDLETVLGVGRGASVEAFASSAIEAILAHAKLNAGVVR